MNLAQYIRDIPDWPKPGILFKDITPLLAEPAAFQQSIDLLADHYHGRTLDAIAAAEARGFLFAAPLALVLKKPLVPLRKPGKLPYRTHALQYDLEYGSAELQVHTDGVPQGASVLLSERSVERLSIADRTAAPPNLQRFRSRCAPTSSALRKDVAT